MQSRQHRKPMNAIYRHLANHFEYLIWLRKCRSKFCMDFPMICHFLWSHQWKVAKGWGWVVLSMPCEGRFSRHNRWPEEGLVIVRVLCEVRFSHYQNYSSYALSGNHEMGMDVFSNSWNRWTLKFPPIDQIPIKVNFFVKSVPWVKELLWTLFQWMQIPTHCRGWFFTLCIWEDTEGARQ